MANALLYIAPLALLLPAGPAGGDAAAGRLPSPMLAGDSGAAAATAGAALRDALLNGPVQRQVRIEQRVTIRISPLMSSPRQAPVPRIAPIDLGQLEERDAGRCLPLRMISAVQPAGGDRLLLYMRDRQVLSLRLRKACRAQDFYSGFYVEPRADRLLCVERDVLRSRTGAKCELDEINRLVAEG